MPAIIWKCAIWNILWCVQYESNARFVKWSDGSMQLLLGGEVLDLSVQNAHQDQSHLFLRHPKVVISCLSRNFIYSQEIVHCKHGIETYLCWFPLCSQTFWSVYRNSFLVAYYVVRNLWVGLLVSKYSSHDMSLYAPATIWICRLLFLQSILQSQGQVLRKMRFMPSSLTSKSHRLLTALVDSRHKKVFKVKAVVIDKDPEKEKEEKEKVLHCSAFCMSRGICWFWLK